MLPLVFFDNYLKGAAYGPGGTDSFALSAPLTLLRFDDSYDVVNQHQGVTMANVDT